MSSLPDQLEHLFTHESNDLELEKKLTALALTRQNEFKQLDGTWALHLYDRSPYIFGSFIVQHLTLQQRDTVEALLRRAETDGQTEIFQKLYPLVASPERWNADVKHLIETAPDFATIAQGITLRKGQWATIEETVLIALYQRDPDAFRQRYGHELAHYSYPRSFLLPSETLDKFRAEVSRQQPNSAFATELFRRFATLEEWHTEVRRLLRERPSNIAHELQIRHLDRADAELDPELQDELVRVFGDAVMPYLNKFSTLYVRRSIEAALQSEADNQQLLAKLTLISNRAWRSFRRTADSWAMTLYERDADFFAPFILSHIDERSACIPPLLEKARLDGRYDFYRSLYANSLWASDWNADLLAVLQSSSSTSAVLRELERLDIRRERRYGISATINDEAAEALYRRSPHYFSDFIWRYLPEGGHYPELLRAIEESGDMDFFLRVFRKVALAPAWEQEMQRLLEQDIPADRILEELDKRKPVNTDDIRPTILVEFMRKYGEAVLPFFENHLDWTTPSRLESLFKLDIDRATLLRELQGIARRQPQEFARRANLWVPPLYKRSPEFFGTFITRHLTWESREFVYEFLPRVEADGHDQLFRDLYAQFYRRDTWHRDIAQLLRANLSDEALHAALTRRASRWDALPDDLATELYRRNPDLFRQFVMAHVRQNYWDRRFYDRLQQEARANGDTALIEAINRGISPETYLRQRLESLIIRDAPPGEVAHELAQIDKREFHYFDNLEIFARLVEKYGDAVMPFILSEGVLRANVRMPQYDQLRTAIQQYTSKATYSRFIFATHAQGYWIEALEQLATRPYTEAEFRAELAYLTPEDNRIGNFGEKTALALYRRFPAAARPLIERFLKAPSLDLFRLAEENRDEDFLDFLTYRMLLFINPLIYRAYPDPSPLRPTAPDQTAREQIEQMGKAATERFDRLYAESPMTYVRRAAHVFSYIDPFELGWNWRSFRLEHNPIWTYLTERHRDDWHHSPEGITELLESPNIYVQIVALDMLSGSGKAAAKRVVENLPAFRALLLGNARKQTKRKALACLEMTARADAQAAERILPLLNETMDFSARRAIPDDIAVAYVRIAQ